MAERVDDGRIAGAVVLVDLAHDGRAVFACPLQSSIGVGDMQHQAHRNRARRRSFQPEFRMFVGQIQHAAGYRDLRVPDSPVVHHDWIPDHDGVEGIGVPRDRGTCVRHA